MDYVEIERARCKALCESIDEKAFLIYCIENSVHENELEEQRKRFDEFPTLEDDIESIM